jgi:organic radical activating enzyme
MRCKTDEDNGIKSLRKTHLEWHGDVGINFEKDMNYPFTPKLFEVRLSNLCNYRCRMCTPNYSSSIAKEIIKNPELKKWHLHQPDFTADGSHLSHQENFLNDIIDMIPTMKAVHFTGGEPMLIPDLTKIIDSMDSQGYISDIILYITTNGSAIIVNTELDMVGFTVKNLAAPVLNADAATKEYVDDNILQAGGGNGFRKTHTMSVDITPVWGQADNDIHSYIVSYLSKMLPINGYNGVSVDSTYAIPKGARANVMCSYFTSTAYDFALNLGKSYVTVNKGTGTNNQPVLFDVGATGTVTTATVSAVFLPRVNHLVKSFVVADWTDPLSAVGTWTFVANIL